MDITIEIDRDTAVQVPVELNEYGELSIPQSEFDGMIAEALQIQRVRDMVYNAKRGRSAETRQYETRLS